MIKIVAVGKIKEKSMSSLIAEYEKRLQPYTKFSIVEVDDVMAPQSNSDAENRLVMEKEGERILSKVKENEYVILLDLHGKMQDSLSFSKQLEDIQLYRSSNITFVIGGSLGLSDAVIQRADYRWKLSDLTFPHQMVRLLLVEQIYRAFKISKNEPYHK